VHTYSSLQAQIVGMEDRWSWTSNDVLLHVLPLHHVHGNVNCLMTPMWCGACCVMMPTFDPAQVLWVVTVKRCAQQKTYLNYWQLS